jgi:hypothetical protein
MALQAASKGQGKVVEMTVFSRAGHHVPIADRTPIIDRFLERHIGVRQRAE